MKYTFGNYKSFKKLIIDKTSSDTLEQLVRTGDIIVPDGLLRCNIQLPSLADSHGLEIIKMDRTDGGYRISINRGEGEIKGLVMSPTNTGELRIFPIADDIRSLVLTDGVADGSITKLLSDASDWFMWTYGGRASNSDPNEPLIYQSPGNNSLQTRLANEEPPVEESLGGRGRGDGSTSGGPNEDPPRRGGISPRPAPIGEVVQEVNLLTIESIVDAEGNSYTVGEDTIALPMVTLTIAGTYHSDVQRIVLWNSEQVALGPNNTWSHDVALSGLGRYTMTFRAFAEDVTGEVYGPEIEETRIILDVEEEVPPLLDYELIEITHVNGQEWSQGMALDPITFPATITITGNYHQVVSGIVPNDRSNLGTLSYDTDALTWTYTETINSAGDITFSFSASYEEDVETETVTLSFEEEVVEQPDGEGDGDETNEPAGISVTDLFSITEVVDSNGDPIVAGFIGSSLGVTVRGEILSANEGIFIDGVEVTVSGNSWEYTTTITETTTLSFTAVDSSDATNIDEESVEISMVSSALAPATVPQTPTTVTDPANPPALVIEESGDVVARGSQYTINNNNFDPNIFPSYSDVFTVTINIAIAPEQTDALQICRFTSEAFLRVNHAASTVEMCGVDFNSSLASNSDYTTIIDLSNEGVTLNDGVERRYTFVFDRRWSVTDNLVNSPNIGSWRLYGFVGEANGTVYGSDQWFYFPKSTNNDSPLIATDIQIRSQGSPATGHFTLKEFGIMLDTALTKEQIEWSISNNKSITEAFTTIPAERTTEIVSQDNMFDVAQDFGTVTTFDHGFSLRGDGAKFFPRGLRYSSLESYGRHNLGKTFAMGVTLWDDFPIDEWRCIISNTLNEATARGWGLWAKKLTAGDVKFMWSPISKRSNTYTVQQTLNEYENNYYFFNQSGIKNVPQTQVVTTTLQDNNAAILFKIAPSSEFRGETAVEVFINDFSTPSIEAIYDNKWFAHTFGASQEGAPWTVDDAAIWDEGTVDLTNTNRTTLLGRSSRHDSNEDNQTGFVGIYSFMKIFYGLTDASMDSLLYAEIQDKFSQFEQPIIEITSHSEAELVNTSTITLSGTSSGLSDFTINGSTVTPNEDGTWTTSVSCVEGENVFTLIGSSSLGLVTEKYLTINCDSITPVITLVYGGQSLSSGATINLFEGESHPVPVVDDGVTPIVASDEVVNTIGASTTVTYTAVDDAGNAAIPFVVTYNFIEFTGTQQLEELASTEVNGARLFDNKLPIGDGVKYRTLNFATDYPYQSNGNQTIAFWFKSYYLAGQDTARDVSIIRIVDSDGSTANYALGVGFRYGGSSSGGTSRQLSLTFSPSAATNGVSHLDFELADQQWHHFIGTFNYATRQATIYRDGQLFRQATLNLDGAYDPSIEAAMRIGKVSFSNGGDLPFIIDGVTLANIHLDDTQAMSLYNSYTAAGDLFLTSENNVQTSFFLHEISGLAPRSSKILIDGQHVATADGQGKWSYELSLIDGQNTFAITATDALGVPYVGEATFSIEKTSTDFLEEQVDIPDSYTTTTLSNGILSNLGGGTESVSIPLSMITSNAVSPTLFSMSFWFKFDGDPNNPTQCAIISSTSVASMIRLRLDASGNLILGGSLTGDIYNGGALENAQILNGFKETCESKGINMFDGSWHHIGFSAEVFANDQRLITVVADGELATTHIVHISAREDTSPAPNSRVRVLGQRVDQYNYPVALDNQVILMSDDSLYSIDSLQISIDKNPTVQQFDWISNDVTRIRKFSDAINQSTQDSTVGDFWEIPGTYFDDPEIANIGNGPSVSNGVYTFDSVNHYTISPLAIHNKRAGSTTGRRAISFWMSSTGSGQICIQEILKNGDPNLLIYSNGDFKWRLGIVSRLNTSNQATPALSNFVSRPRVTSSGYQNLTTEHYDDALSLNTRDGNYHHYFIEFYQGLVSFYVNGNLVKEGFGLYLDAHGTNNEFFFKPLSANESFQIQGFKQIHGDFDPATVASDIHTAGF